MHLRSAHVRRATCATGANPTSSRSHALCTLRLLRSGGELLLGDFAGTERRKDSMHHSRERQQEGAEINASLHALKECVRHAASRQQVPTHVFRGSSLTKLLARAFLRNDSRNAPLLNVICTASPCTSDTEHTLTTLRTAVALGGFEEARADREELSGQSRTREVHPKQWTAEKVSDWLASVNGGQFRGIRDALPSNFTGQMLVRLSECRCIQLCGGDRRRGDQLFRALHDEILRAGGTRRSAR